MVKVGGVTTADSDMSCSLRGWIHVRRAFETMSILRAPCGIVAWRGFFGNPYAAREPKWRVNGFVAPSYGDTAGRTKLANPIENKGFSTALILRLGSTIRFGHASAARDF